MEANVILSKCNKHNRLFGIRIEKRDGDWVRTWAFKIDETKAKNEGFDRTAVKGSLNPTPDYPGCPHCGAETFVRCGTCGKISCLKCEHNSARCHWCGTNMESITSASSFDVTSGGY